MLKHFAFSLFAACALFVSCANAQNAAALKVAILSANAESNDFAVRFAAQMQNDKRLKILDADAATAAASAVLPASENKFNLTLETAKNLGAAIDCDYFLIIEHKALPRSSFAKPEYFESYAIIFLASARTGRLIAWRDRFFEADSIARALEMQRSDLPALTKEFAAKLFAAHETERQTRAAAQSNVVALDELPDEETKNFRAPQPFRRVKPEYTAAAQRLSRAATVDIAVELDARGSVIKVEIVRWAGFGLDESVAETVKKMFFRPALRDNQPVGITVLLRYNFRSS